MKNPYDVGHQVGSNLASKLVAEAEITPKHVIAVYAGRFQPFHKGHYSVYKLLASKFGSGNVYIGTSDVVSMPKSPFSFSEKREIISRMFNIPSDKIQQVKSPFAPEEILNKFDSKTTAMVTAFSSKDAGRLHGGKYYLPYPGNTKDLEGYMERGYYIIAPEFQMSVGGQNISGTVIRTVFSDSNSSVDAKKALFKKLYGKFDQHVFDLIMSKLSSGVKEGVDMISRVLVDRFRGRRTLTEGGAAGHMAHPFDDFNLTFGDLKRIVELGLSGQLNVEAPVTEKLDGQNISVSSRDDRGAIFARTTSHMKNGGINAMNASQIAQMFSGRGDLSNAFTYAASDLDTAISKLSKLQKEEMFGQGSKWMSIEIIYPATQNVIPYGQNMLVFHNAFGVDEQGHSTDVIPDTGRALESMLKQINQNVQKTFSFGGPVVVDLPRSENFSRRKGFYFGRISKLQNQFGLSDADPVMMWHQAWWASFIDSQASRMKYAMSNNVREGLLKRWAFQQTGAFSVNDMKQQIVNKRLPAQDQARAQKFLDWALDYDKTNKEEQFKKNIAPFEMIFLQLGADILQKPHGLLSASPGEAAASLRKELTKTIADLRRTSDVSQLTKVNNQLAKIDAIGINKLVPAEGIVFMYKGKVYKLTGAFAPLNQILGAMKYGGR